MPWLLLLCQDGHAMKNKAIAGTSYRRTGISSGRCGGWRLSQVGRNQPQVSEVESPAGARGPYQSFTPLQGVMKTKEGLLCSQLRNRYW
jgi:hypothetical protein